MNFHFFSSLDRQVSQKTCYTLGFLAVACCVLVGLIVFYLTAQECGLYPEEDPITPSPGPGHGHGLKAEKKKKEKVSERHWTGRG